MVKRGLIIFILLASTAATIYLYTSHDSSRLETEASMIEFSPVEPESMGVDERLEDFKHLRARAAGNHGDLSHEPGRFRALERGDEDAA